MTKLNPATEAEGTAVANTANPPPEDKGAICDTEKIESEQKMDIDEKKETNEKKGIHGKEEGENEKDVNVKDGEVQEHGEKKKEGEVEDDGEKKKECEVEDGEKKKEGEVKENGDEKKEGKEMKDVEEKEDGQQNGITKLGNMDGVKEVTESVNTAEAEDVKMVDAEHAMADDAVDVKMVDAEDVKDEEKGGETCEQEGAQNKTENDVNKEGDGGTTVEKVDEDEEADGSKKKRSRVKKASQKGKGKDKEGEKKAKELLGSPVSSIERPVRERKTVERLVEVIEKEPNREFQVEKGRGTPLKDIPNVAYKLARKKPADIKLIHQTLFGRKGKAVNFKSHILQFSGFVWHESDEKQRAKMKEKLEKYVRDTLLDLCDLFDLPVSRANSRKEDLVSKLLDFLVAPHPTTDVVLAEKDQKSRKRKRMVRASASKSRGGMPTKSSKKWTKSEDTPIAKDSSAQETEDDEEYEKEKDLSEKEKVHKHSESEAKETESGEAADEDEDEDDDIDENDEEKLGKGKQDKKKAIKQRGSAAKEKLKVGTSPKKSSLPTTTKSPAKRSSSKHSKDEEDNDASTKVFTSRKRNSDSPKKKSTPKSNTKEKTTDKKMARGKTKQLDVEQPSKEELRKKICEVLKEVDFNTATFTDILKQLATYYKMDLTPRKASLKLMIQGELIKLAEEAKEDEEDDNDGEKEEKPEPKGEEVEA